MQEADAARKRLMRGFEQRKLKRKQKHRGH